MTQAAFGANENKKHESAKATKRAFYVFKFLIFLSTWCSQNRSLNVSWSSASRLRSNNSLQSFSPRFLSPRHNHLAAPRLDSLSQSGAPVGFSKDAFLAVRARPILTPEGRDPAQVPTGNPEALSTRKWTGEEGGQQRNIFLSPLSFPSRAQPTRCSRKCRHFDSFARKLSRKPSDLPEWKLVTTKVTWGRSYFSPESRRFIRDGMILRWKTPCEDLRIDVF